MRRWLAIAMVVVLAIGAAACGSSDETSSGGEPSESTESPVKLKVYLLSEDVNRTKVYEEYYAPNVKREFPNLDVEFELPGKAFNDKLKVYNASGDLPDVFWGTDLVVESGNALDLTPYIEQDGFAAKYKNSAGLMPYKDGKIYSLSAGTDSYFTGVLFYHKDLFEQHGIALPTSFEELVDVSKQFQEKGIIPISMMSWAIQTFFYQDFLLSGSPQDVTDLATMKTKFTDKPSLDAIEKIKTLVDVGAFPKDAATIDFNAHVELFNSGKAAMIYHPLWILDSIKDNADLDFLYLPTFSKTAQALNVWGSPSNGFMVAKNGKHIEESVKLAEWLATQDAKFFSEQQGNAVALDVGVELDNVNPITQHFIDLFNDKSIVKVSNLNANAFNEATRSELDVNVGKLLTRQVTSRQFAEAMDKMYSAQER